MKKTYTKFDIEQEKAMRRLENARFRASVRAESLKVFAKIATPKQKKKFAKMFGENVIISPTP